MLGLLPALPCLLLLALPGPGAGSDEDSTVVLTTSGPIRGKRLPVGSSSVTAFLGVPYAQPPVGPLRFQKPLPHQPWSHVLEATSFGHACPQILFSNIPEASVWMPKTPQSEDCLFLNVWVPHPRPPEPVPILVWIHGGGFMGGAACLDMYNGRFLAATENVVVASMNYRLGALGFLALPPAAPGNAGMWDQRLALRWLRDNAAAFGGDPARVLLFGQSAGGASVSFHLLSPGSRPLFTRAAMQSGVATAPWAWVSLHELQEKGRRLGRLLGCSESDDTALVSCLQGKEPREFLTPDPSDALPKELFSKAFVPTPDGDFLPDVPDRLLRADRGQPLPILTGVTADEGTFLLKFSSLHFILRNISAIGQEHLLQMVKLLAPRAPEEAIWAVVQRYSQDRQDDSRYLWAMGHTSGDYGFVCPVAEVARQEVEAGRPVYGYHFTHRNPVLPMPEWMGVPHGAELPYLFGTLASLRGANYTLPEAETVLSRRVMRYWAEFARSGSPTGPGSNEEPWPLFNSTEQNLMRISTEPLQMEGTSPTRHCNFLTSLLGEKPSSQVPETHATAKPSKEREHEKEKEN